MKGKIIIVSWYNGALMLSWMTMNFTDLVLIVVKVWKYFMPEFPIKTNWRRQFFQMSCKCKFVAFHNIAVVV